MNVKHEQENPVKSGSAGELVKNKDAIVKLARSGDAQKLMSMLNQKGGVQQAAQEAAAGNPGALMNMMDQLMKRKEGAELVERISRQAKEAGL